MYKNKRNSMSGTRMIELTKTNPLERLKELCNQGRYLDYMVWDKFKNGTLISGHLYTIINNKRYIVKKIDMQNFMKSLSFIDK